MGEPEKCHLLGGLFATCIQIFLGLVCMFTLIFKRHTENPRREWHVWFFDVTKQGMGASLGHFANIFLSEIIAATLSEAGSDECQWYCLTYVLDTTLGTVLNILLLYFVEDIMMGKCKCCTSVILGNYGNPPSWIRFLPQLMIWLSIVMIAKVFTLLLIYQFIAPINNVMQSVFSVLESKPNLELVMVMIVIPTILNTLSFWVVDTFLKGKDDTHQRLESSDLDEDLIPHTDLDPSSPRSSTATAFPPHSYTNRVWTNTMLWSKKLFKPKSYHSTERELDPHYSSSASSSLDTKSVALTSLQKDSSSSLHSPNNSTRNVLHVSGGSNRGSNNLFATSPSLSNTFNPDDDDVYM